MTGSVACGPIFWALPQISIVLALADSSRSGSKEAPALQLILKLLLFIDVLPSEISERREPSLKCYARQYIPWTAVLLKSRFAQNLRSIIPMFSHLHSASLCLDYSTSNCKFSSVTSVPFMNISTIGGSVQVSFLPSSHLFCST